MKTQKRKYTPSEILTIFREQHRLASPLDLDAVPFMEIHAAMSIRDWRIANDLLPWRKLYRSLNEEFWVDIPKATWKAVLVPARKRKLWDVCQLLAQYAETEIIAPIKILGTECLSAGIFRIMKRKMDDKGVPVSELKPSSRLGPYLEKHFLPVFETITLMGFQSIEKITVSRRKKGCWNAINIFDPDRYEVSTGDIVTFRDLIERNHKHGRGLCKNPKKKE